MKLPLVSGSSDVPCVPGCSQCTYRQGRPFCNFGPEALRHFDKIGHSVNYRRGATLFSEGQRPSVVSVLCQGKVRLSATSLEGKRMILSVAQLGDVLGLSAALEGKVYEVTAEAAAPCRTRQIKLNDFLVFVNRFAEAGVHAAQCLNKDYRQALHNLRRVTLSASAAEKLAGFLLERANRDAMAKSEWKADLGLTREEIGQILDMSRETVSRLVSRFKRQGLITVRGGTVTIRNRRALLMLLGIQSGSKLPHQMS